MYRIRLTRSPRPAWFAEWLDPGETVMGLNHFERYAMRYASAEEAQRDAERIMPIWRPVVEEAV